MIKKKNLTVDDFQFISEKPKDGELLFGHIEIVLTLEKVVLKSPEAFTIGLYGDWGSGKSSIAETLQSNLKSKYIPLVIFDVWKHEGDGLRRTFLKDLDKKLSGEKFGKVFYKEGFELEKNIDSQIRGNISKGYELEWKKLLKHVFLIGCFFALLIFSISGILWLVGRIFSFDSKPPSNVLEIVTLFIGGISVPIIYWFKYFNSFIKERKEEFVKEQFQDPIEFEKSFHSILNNLTKKVEKIVIVFDNLDRVTGKKAVEIISTIKTFLEPADRDNRKDIVFIIPCDSVAIKKHLQMVFGSHSNDYADEFLRKFFNTIVWIPQFYDTELQKLAFIKLKETKVRDLDSLDLAALITLVFDQNPRQIIQFINILLANYLLLKERNISGFSLKSNVTQLAKYLLLKQKFPKIMEIYRDNKVYNLNEDIKKLLEDNLDIPDKDKLEDFYDFIELTRPWKIESLDLFFKFRLTEFEAAFENSTKLISLLQSNRVKEILSNDTSEKLIAEKEYLDSLKITEKTDELSNIVKQKVRNNNYPLIVTQFINGLFDLTSHYKINLNDDAYRAIYNKFRTIQFKNEFYRMDIKYITEECIRKISNERLKSDFTIMAKHYG